MCKTGCSKSEDDIFDALDINTSDIRLSDKIRILFIDFISTKNFMDISSDTYSMIKYYKLYRENEAIRVQENAAKEQGYNCVLRK